MSSSTVSQIPLRDSSKRRKRKKLQQLQSHNNDQITKQNNKIQWKSDAQQQIYSSKLLQALRHVRRSTGTSTGTSSTTAGAGTSARKHAVRETADRVLAVTAKGRTRWSRAILTNKLKIKNLKRSRRERGLIVSSAGSANSRLKKPRVSILRLKTKNLPAVQRKTRVLGGLVPGCKKQSLPVVLEEATDYIPALEMQVKALAALVELLSGGSSSGLSSGSGAGDGGGGLNLLSYRPQGRL
ncbi:atBS1(activation-tagged BRI1 suppressor 1)-interacting factor 1 [Artemisia annua]|uniref:AtBS1(Activation-tagged BRI1 suppressor 1)-interacting factor 1 n=1 Tax=Artemisia annua TaxID=35608 RepID=A0A2U1MYX3_ARTAN|nr:atBS1(activation-tagged BRI1 suppressor 1)-interacting factor 1 [Artemisia annua]